MSLSACQSWTSAARIVVRVGERSRESAEKHHLLLSVSGWRRLAPNQETAVQSRFYGAERIRHVRSPENRAGLQGRCGAARCGSRWCCLRGGCADRLPHAAGGDRGENSGVIAASTRTRVIRSDSVLLRGPRNLCGLACVQPAMTDCPEQLPDLRVGANPGDTTVRTRHRDDRLGERDQFGHDHPVGSGKQLVHDVVEQTPPAGRPFWSATPPRHPPGGQIQRNPTAPLAHRLPGNSHARNRAEMPTLCAVTFSPAGPLMAVSADRPLPARSRRWRSGPAPGGAGLRRGTGTQPG